MDVDLVEKLINKFAKLTSDIKLQIELEIFALEESNKYANDMGGDFGEDYYLYFEDLFEETLKKHESIKPSKTITKKIETIIETAFEGYGHRDTLEDTWAEFND